jgi:hypothetical protein
MSVLTAQSSDIPIPHLPSSTAAKPSTSIKYRTLHPTLTFGAEASGVDWEHVDQGVVDQIKQGLAKVS